MSDHETVDEMLDAYEEAAAEGSSRTQGASLEEMRAEVQGYIEELEDTIFRQQTAMWEYWEKDGEDMDNATLITESDLLDD